MGLNYMSNNKITFTQFIDKNGCLTKPLSLLNALYACRNKKVRFTITVIGSGKNANIKKDYIEESAIQEAIKKRGKKPKGIIRSLMQRIK